MSGYTKGPWKLNESIDDEGVYVATIKPDLKDDAPYIGAICRFQDCAHIKGIGVPEAKANARLLLASKDMYEALKAQIVYETCPSKESPQRWNEFIDLRDAALTKAEGK